MLMAISPATVCGRPFVEFIRVDGHAFAVLRNVCW